MIGINRSAFEVARASAHAGVRASAVSQIGVIASQLAEHAVPSFRPFDLWKARLAVPHMLPVAAADAIRAAENLRGLVRWVDDGQCLSRAVIGAARMDDLVRGASVGTSDAVGAAVAIVNTSQRKTGWVFHAATAFRSAEDDGIRVIDHVLGAKHGNASGIFRVEEWAGHVGRSAKDVRIQSLLDNVPVGGNVTIPATARTLRSFGKRLVSSILHA
ncbi:MAG: hypothetical protein JWL76_1162 [Thermoleophilia bacterium]|nr:hypothetical protein [Thermoleophilia bacterium]